MKLFINACVRRDSRTRQLAEAVMAEDREAYREVYLPAISFPKVDEAFLEWRNGCVAQGERFRRRGGDRRRRAVLGPLLPLDAEAVH